MFAEDRNTNRLELGSVQFGLDYGVSNREGGITHEPEVAEILKYAWEKGVSIIDTAPSYGVSEDVVGRSIKKNMAFRVITKTPIFKDSTITKSHAVVLKNAFHESLKRIRQPTIYGLLIHHTIDLLKYGSQYLWDVMEGLKREGFVQKIGVSVYSPTEVDDVLSRYPLDIVQLPFNVIDQRMIQTGHLHRLKKQGIEIHSRSVFLQGLLLMPLGRLPDYFNPYKRLLRRYHELLQERSVSLLSAALGFAFACLDIDYIVVGVNKVTHLEAIVDTVNSLKSYDPLDFSEYALADESMINPALWRLS